jgi:predicted CXXCH cytochrome family protein
LKTREKGEGRREKHSLLHIFIAGILALGIVAFAVPGLVYASHEDSSCVSCHQTLDNKNAHSARQWERDIHQRAGMDCADCHGGDREKVEGAMDPGTGFKGVPEGMDSIRLCGNCHSDSSLISNPVLATGQLDQFLSGPHGKSIAAGEEGPLCVTCHGAHGIVPVDDPSSDLWGTAVTRQCLTCHGQGKGKGDTTAGMYLEGVHYLSLAEGRNHNAPTCVDCHGAHQALTPSPAVSARICGRCHTRELEYYQSGPHGHSVIVTGQPACTDCHDHHRTQATGLEELVGRITDRCWGCHPTGSGPWEKARAIDESLTRAMELLGELEKTSSELALDGIQTSQIDRYNREAYSWLVQVESALHSVDNRWEELTGMAKVKMMASWSLSRDHFLEKRIRAVLFLLLSLLFVGITILLAVKLRSVEEPQHRRHALGSPEARQLEQERHGR